MAIVSESRTVRRPRGAARRDKLAAAALELVERDGLEAVTHRRVADLAGVPLAATTYYFASKNELLQAAMVLHKDREAEELRAIADAVVSAELTVSDGIEAMVAWQVAALRDHRQLQFAQFELYLRVARTAGPPEGERWTTAFHDMAAAVFAHFGSTDPDLDARALTAVCHGLSVECLTAVPAGAEEAMVAPVLRAFLRSRLLDGPR